MTTTDPSRLPDDWQLIRHVPRSGYGADAYTLWPYGASSRGCRKTPRGPSMLSPACSLPSKRVSRPSLTGNPAPPPHSRAMSSA